MSAAPRWPVAVALSALALAVLIWADAHGAPRVALALWCLLACPGMALVPLLADLPPRLAVPLVVGVSLSVETIVVTALLAAGAFSPTAAALALAGVCTVGCWAQLRMWARTRPPTTVVFHT